MLIARKYFIENLMSWGKDNYRYFPWRKKGLSIYESLIAEVLLRKTTSLQVSLFYEEFIKLFPNPGTLNIATKDTIMEILKPLGLYRQRATVLKDITEVICSKGLSFNHEDIKALPHVGTYTANAVACFCLGERAPIIDTNVIRVYSRFFGISGQVDARRNKEVSLLAEELLPTEGFVDYNYSLLDFSAIICKGRGKPLCGNCPVEEKCHKYHLK